MLAANDIDVSSSFKHHGFSDNIFYPVEILEDNLKFVHKTDTHYSSVGTCEVVKSILVKLGFQINIEPIFEKSSLIGDLNRMQNDSSKEEIYKFIGFKGGITKPVIYNNRQSLSGNSGHIKISRNPLSKIDKRLVIIGDSFFSEDALSSCHTYLLKFFIFEMRIFKITW